MKTLYAEKKTVDKLVDEFSENIDENEMTYNLTLKHYQNVCECGTVHTVLFVIAILIIIDISSAFICFRWYLKK